VRARARAPALGALLALAFGCGAEPPAAPAVEPPATSAPERARPGSPNARFDIAEGFAADRAARRDPSDGAGKAWLAEAPERVVAGGSASFAFVFEAGPQGIAEGGALFLQVPPFWGWSTPQASEPAAAGFTDVETDAEGVTLRAVTLDQGLLAVEIAGRALRAGERVRLRYGSGAAGARVDLFAERGVRFFFAVDGDGDGVRAFLADAPAVDVAAGPPAQLVALLPSVARPGEPVRLALAVLDAQGSSGVDFTGELSLALPDGVEGPARVRVGAGGLAEAQLVARAAGVVRVRAEGPDGLAAESNPLLVSARVPRVRWGDLHGHSGHSDGTGTAEDYLRYARDVAALDVAALTDHDHWGIPFLDEAPEGWRAIVAATRTFHAPGRFVTLLGYEWTSWIYGHRHVLHLDDEAVVLSSVDPATDTPGELWDALRAAGRPALTLAHHSAGDPVATDWSIPPDRELEPVTEVASVHGSSEAPDAPSPVRGGLPGNWVRDALGRGYRLGFVGSGDSHDGHPGLAQLAAGTSGLAAILAEELTREAVLDALRARRCYATNGPRIVLQVELDGAPMGSTLPAAGTHRIEVSVVAPGPLEAVELVTQDGVLERLPANGERLLAFETELRPAAPGTALYVRVLQADGGAAWSSPFFFE
jgi:hypothetical protein